MHLAQATALPLDRLHALQKDPMKRFVLPTAVTAGVALAVLVAPAAQAHVHVDPSTTAAGSTAQLSFSFAHGCEGSPTTALEISVPDSIVSAVPNVHSGWSINTEKTGDHVDTVRYTALTPVADGLRDTVTVQVALPATADGQTLAFPVRQVCETGETNWADIAAEGQSEDDLELPAPTIEVTAASADGGHGHAAAAPEASEHEAASAAVAEAQPDILARVLAVAALILGAGAAASVFTLNRQLRRRPSTASASTPTEPKLSDGGN